jgi:hypothetical protein
MRNHLKLNPDTIGRSLTSVFVRNHIQQAWFSKEKNELITNMNAIPDPVKEQFEKQVKLFG